MSAEAPEARHTPDARERPNGRDARASRLLECASRVANLGFWRWDAEQETLHAYTDVTPVLDPESAAEGVGREEALSWLSAEWRAVAEQAVTRSLETGAPVETTLQVGDARSRPRWVRVFGRPVMSADGRVMAIEGAFVDLTEQLTLKDRAEERAALLEKAHDAMLVTEMDWTLTFWNPAAERLFGWRADDVLGRRVDDLLSTSDPMGREAREALVEAGEWTGEIEHVRPDGVRVVAEARGTLIRDEDDRPSRILMVCTDVTERRDLFRQFLRAQRMESIGMLSGGVAHDLNNVLSPILLTTDLLKESVRDPGIRESLDTIERSAKHGSDLVKQILTFARGKDGPSAELDVGMMVREIARVVENTFPKHIRLERQLEDGLWPLKADPTQVHQILLNLCVNARDAMSDGGTLTVRVSNTRIDTQYAGMSREARAGDFVRIEVRDTGTGIPEELLPRVFDPFFTTKEAGSGTGLGLSTVAAITRAHQGFVEVASQPGRGASFVVYLPAAARTEARNNLETTPERSVSPHPSPRRRRGRGEHVLVVDDEAAVRSITQQTLESFGYRVLTAGDGTDAVALYGKWGDDIDLVLLDMAMPIMGGDATIQALRRMDTSVRIVAVSGGETGGKNEASPDPSPEKVVGMLTKPYTAHELLDTLAHVLGDRAVASS